MKTKFVSIVISLLMIFNLFSSFSLLHVNGEEDFIIVDDTETSSEDENYFAYTEQTDPSGANGWASDKKESIIGIEEAKTQHWVWSEDYDVAKNHTYSFTFKGTGVELIGVKNDNQNTFQLDENAPETVTISGVANTPVVLYSKKDLIYGKHTVYVTLPAGTGLQVSYAKVFGSKIGEVEKTTIPHTKMEGDSNKFIFAENAWEAGGSEHTWSKAPSASLEAADIWYEVKFVGHKIDVYAGKNKPMGKVRYYIDGIEVGDYSLYSPSNISSTLIASFDGLTEGEHTFKAVATGEKDSSATNYLIDCAKVDVYHAPYTVKDVIIDPLNITLMEGAAQKINVTAVPDYAETSDLTFVSSNNKTATVSANGTIQAESVGAAKITVSSEKYNISKEVGVTVEPANPQIGGSVVDTDSQYTQDRYDEVKELGLMSKELTAWQNDKAISEIVVFSKESSLKNVTVKANDLTDASGNKISSINITPTFIKSTKAYNGGYLGYGDPNRVIPEDNGTNRSESNDILYQTEPIDIPFNKLQPIWLEIAIPKTAKAGIYTTTIEITANGIDTPLVFTYTVNVQNIALPDASTYKDTFDIELWQYPYSSAEYYNVEPFSDKHLEIMKSSMEIYKSLGGHAITTSILEEAWNGQTYSANEIHYPSMVKWTKNSDGSFAYDYTHFDKWVEFNKNLGIGDKIVLYSIAPWHNSFTYWENDKLIKEPFSPGSARYNQVWGDFLQDMVEHLMAKGWFDETYMGIDERGFNVSAFDLIDSVKNIHGQSLKTAGAMDAFVNKHDLALRVHDLNVGDTAAAASPTEFTKLVAEREALGYKTTLYSCTEHQPGNFSLSAPVESYWSIINAGEETEGFLRWAYDAWVSDPTNDTTHNSFEPGDCFLIYPDDKDAENPTSKRSVRLERMAEGMRDVNKIKYMLSNIPSLQNDVATMYSKITVQVKTARSYMNTTERANLTAQMNTFKRELNELSDRYVALQESGTNIVESVTIVNTDSNLPLGQSVQLATEVLPENLINKSVTWASSDESIAGVTDSGVATGKKVGKVTVTATSKQDGSKADTFNLNVVSPQIEKEAQVSYYNFDDNFNDSWGLRNGTNNGASFAAGKSENALYVESGENVALDTPHSIGVNDPWTVSYWVKTTAPFNDRISVLMDESKAYSFDLKMSSDRFSGYHVGYGAGDVLTYKYDFMSNEWYHVSWTQSKTSGLSMYVNGQLVANNAWTKTNTAKIPLDIIGGTGFTGFIDELKVFNRELAQSEINSLMLVNGLNLIENTKNMFTGETYEIQTNLISDEEDKTIIYSSNNPEVATVDSQGVVTAFKKGTSVITVENKASGYKDTVTVNVSKKLTISNTLPIYMLSEEHLLDIEKAPGTDRQYLGQPDMIQTKTGRLIQTYPIGHGKGPLVMRVSDDLGETWTEKKDIPVSWAGSQETPTLFALPLENGKERLLLVTACPGWGVDSDGNRYGWNTSYSDDNGETWTEYEHWYSKRAHDNANNDVIVAMSSLVRLKDENGNYIQKWMGVYHTYGYVNYKTYLTFDENGNEQWSEPVPYLSEHRNIESTYQICEVGMFRSPDGNRIIGLTRSQSHNNPSTLIYSDDEGKTWSRPMDLPGSLAGERHKVVYDPISGRLVISFREIMYDLSGNNQFDGNNDWICGDWGVWVGTYEDLMNQEEGDYRIRIAEDWATNAKSGDTGYAGVVVLNDGTLIMNSYGHWDKEFSQGWSGGVTTDLCYIIQAKFKLGDVENAYNLVDRENLNIVIEALKNTDESLYTPSSFKLFKETLNSATEVNKDNVSQQIQVDSIKQSLTETYNTLVRRADTSELEKLISETEKIDLGAYTQNSVSSLLVSLQNARSIYADKDATQGQINIAFDSLKTAIDNLKEKPADLGDLDASFLAFLIDYAESLIEDGTVDKAMPIIAEQFYKELEKAKILLEKIVADPENSTQEEINQAVEDLLDIISMIDFEGNKDKLQRLIYLATRYAQDKDLYRPATYAVFEKALKVAQGILDDPYALQDEIDPAWEDLAGGIAKLRKIPNKQGLIDAIERAKAVDSKLYTAESYLALASFITKGEAVLGLNDDSIPAEGIKESAKDINTAFENLVPVADVIEPIEGTATTENTTKSSEETTITLGANASSKAPKTGETSALVLVSLALLMAALAIVFARKRKEN